jgi:precorrin-2 dehydrogenase/sirohydrochlorin ferrochelatase
MQDLGNTLFPVFFRLDKLRVVVIGGGAVGTEKTTAILNSSPDASLKIVAKEFREELIEFCKDKKVELVQKAYKSTDLDGYDLVIAATCFKVLNEEIHRDAKEKKILINVADTPDLCDFYLSSIVKKGDLKIAISTNGKSPTFAKRMRELLTEALPDSIDLILQNLNNIRESLKGDFEYKVKKMEEVTSSMKDKNTEK